MVKIVIIDDEAAVLKMMSQLCERLGHETYAFQTGTEGMTFIRRNTPEIMIDHQSGGDGGSRNEGRQGRPLLASHSGDFR